MYDENKWSNFCREFSEWLRTTPEKEIQEGLKYLAEGAQEHANLIKEAQDVRRITNTDQSKVWELLDTSEQMAKEFGLPENEVYEFRLKFIQGHRLWWLKKGTPYFEKEINSYII